MENSLILPSLNGETPVSRRDFMKKAIMTFAGITVVGSVVPLMSSCSNSVSPTVSHGTATISVSMLTTDGQAVKSTVAQPEGTSLLIVRKSATTYLAMSTYCAHQGCEVNTPVNGVIHCPCHSSVFDPKTGALLSGPASRGLSTYTTVYNATANTVTVTY